MSNEGGPWGRQAAEPTPAPKRPGARWALWLAVVVAGGAIVAALARAFPEALRTRDDWFQLAYGLGFMVLLSAGLLRVSRTSISQHLKHAAIWIGVVAVLAVGVAYREELAGVPQRLRVTFSGGAPVATAEHELTVPQDEGGAFLIVGKVNGERVRFIVDTGATDTVLAPEDARRIGVDLGRLTYDSLAETANGTGRGARVTVDRLEVGPILVDDFPVLINSAPMGVSLLGVSFLNRLESYEVRGRKLVLRWRDAGS